MYSIPESQWWDFYKCSWFSSNLVLSLRCMSASQQGQYIFSHTCPKDSFSLSLLQQINVHFVVEREYIGLDSFCSHYYCSPPPSTTRKASSKFNLTSLWVHGGITGGLTGKMVKNLISEYIHSYTSKPL